MKNSLFLLFLSFFVVFYACKRATWPNEPMFKDLNLRDSSQAKKFKTFAVQIPANDVKDFMITKINNNSNQYAGIKVSKADLLRLIDTVTQNSGTNDSIRIVIGGIGGNYPNQQIIMQSGSDDIAAVGTCHCMNPCCPYPTGSLNETTIPKE